MVYTDKDSLNSLVTIVVNSCDSYADLWMPFFTLLKKYWDPEGIRILLNTEAKDYHFDGLSIECVHPSDVNDPYGKRMIHVLSQVTTPYVIPLLDDFFLRKPVDEVLIRKIITWMHRDKKIVYFNCDCTPTYCLYETDLYPGFKRLPNGNPYFLNMQAAVWRTEKLLAYWRPQVSPWEWEEYTNLLAARSRSDKFYCVTDQKNAFCDYGYNLKGMGVHRGKWVEDDVVPLFEREGIVVDFSKRGFLSYENNTVSGLELRSSLKTIHPSSEMINRCLGHKDALRYSFFVRRNRVLGLSRNAPDILYVKYQLAKEQKKFKKTEALKQKMITKRSGGSDG